MYLYWTSWNKVYPVLQNKIFQGGINNAVELSARHKDKRK